MQDYDSMYLTASGSLTGERDTVPETAQNRPKLTKIEEIAADLFTISEFCSAVRISQRQYFRLRAVGHGPKVTALGGRVLIARQAIEDWLWQHEEGD